jgi:hypothetical protein
MNALMVGGRAALYTYRGGTLSGYNDDLSDYRVRVSRYDQYQFWYDNMQFDTINTWMTTARAHQNLYRHIRGIYNPVHRLVNLEVAKVYGGGIDWSGGLRVGAIPIVGANPTLLEAIMTILKWSNFGTEKANYVRQGSKFGESYLKVVDDAERGRVRIEVLSPYKVREVRFNEVGDIKWIAIQYYRTDDEGKDYLFREEIDQQEFRYWISYKLNAFDDRLPEVPTERYPNPYGFVPVRQTPHTRDTDSRYGVPSFHGSLGKVVQLNDIAAPIHDAVRLAVNPIYVSKGGILPANTDDGTRDRDEVKVLNIPKDGALEALSPTLNISDGLAAMDKLIGEIERDMPQLSLQRIRESGGDASGVSIENSYSDASSLLIELQGSYDEGLIRALQMAISVAAYRGYDQFRAFNKDTSYEQGALDFYIKEREVFSDRLTPDRKIELLNQSANLPTLPIVARDLGYSEDDIEEMMGQKEEQQAQQIAAGIRAAAQAAGMNNEGDDSEDTQTEDDTEAIPSKEDA